MQQAGQPFASLPFYANLRAEPQDRPEVTDQRVLVCLRKVQQEGEQESSFSVASRLDCYLTCNAHVLRHRLSVEKLEEHNRDWSLFAKTFDPDSKLLDNLERSLTSDTCRLVYRGDCFENAGQAAIITSLKMPDLPKPVPMRLPLKENCYFEHCPPEEAKAVLHGIALALGDCAAHNAALGATCTQLEQALSAAWGRVRALEDEKERLLAAQNHKEADNTNPTANLRKRPLGPSSGGSERRAFNNGSAMPPASQQASPPSKAPHLTPFPSAAALQQNQPSSQSLFTSQRPLQSINIASQLPPFSQQQHITGMPASQAEPLSQPLHGVSESRALDALPSSQLPDSQSLASQHAGVSQLVGEEGSSQSPGFGTQPSSSQAEQHSQARPGSMVRGRGRRVPTRGKGPHQGLFGKRSG